MQPVAAEAPRSSRLLENVGIVLSRVLRTRSAGLVSP